MSKMRIRFVDVATLSDEERRRYWQENYPLVKPWVLPDDELSMEVKRQGLPMNRTYYAIIERGEEG